MSAQAEPRRGSGVWDFLKSLSEKHKKSSQEQVPEEHPRMRIGRYAAAVFPAALLLYYCTHAALYAGEHNTFILSSGRTYVVSLICFLLIVLALVPVRLSEHANRIVAWIWFVLAPFAVYFSLLYMDASKFNIKFFELNRIALVLTFVFLFLLETAVLIVTGSIRFAVVTMAVLIAALGIANSFVISFRGMALSAADLFSLGAAASVASEYTYELDWYMYMELLCTLAICMFSLKLHGGRMLHPALRAAVLVLWCGVAGSCYYLCCRTDFLEQHDIRSQGFTHQLRYKNYDMIFTTLTTCFYLSVEKPEGYSLDKVKEIAAPYLTGEDDGDGENAAAADTDAKQVSEDTANVAEGTSVKTVSEDAGSKNATNTAAAGESAKQSSLENTASQTDGGNTANSGDNSTASTSGNAAANAAIAAGETPNLIVIMNESFADYTSIGKGLDLSEDCIPFIHSLTENTIKGTAYVSIFGGNTPNSEYEFLTGNTMGFLPASSVGFNLFVRGNLPSVASELKSQGYETLAMHPYRGTNYRRNLVYPQIGFDTFYTRDDFTQAKYIRSYISDDTLAQRIITEFNKHEESSDTPLFSYNVTIQNHGGYFASNTRNLDLDIAVQDSEVDQTKTTLYVNLIKESDQMFENLVNYFENKDAPTVIVMFGDHQANLGDNTYEYLVGNEDEISREERMEKYKVPFVIWANYDIPEETIEKTSLNYLYSILADRLDFPMTGYQKYLLALSEKIPALCAQGYWGDDGNYYELDDESSPYYDLVNEYNILEYNDIFGGKDRDLEFFADVQG